MHCAARGGWQQEGTAFRFFVAEEIVGCWLFCFFLGGRTASVLQNKQKTALVNTKAKT